MLFVETEIASPIIFNTLLTVITFVSHFTVRVRVRVRVRGPVIPILVLTTTLTSLSVAKGSALCSSSVSTIFMLPAWSLRVRGRVQAWGK